MPPRWLWFPRSPPWHGRDSAGQEARSNLADSSADGRVALNWGFDAAPPDPAELNVQRSVGDGQGDLRTGLQRRGQQVFVRRVRAAPARAEAVHGERDGG